MTSCSPKVTAVIVTYNSRGTIGHTLDALREGHKMGFADVVVVDNASADDTADFIAEKYPWVTLVRSDENLGYGRGCNLGFNSVHTPYMLILNPDAVIGVVALQTLADFLAANDRVGVAAPAILEGDEHYQAAGLMTTPSSLLKSAFGFSRPMHASRVIMPGEPPFRTPWVCGAIMLIRADLFRKLGGFDPRFFLYFEETDLCRRVTQLGLEIWAVGEAVAEHIGGASTESTGQFLESSCIAEHFYCSRFYYLVKHFGWVRAVGTESIVRGAYYLRSFKGRLTGREKRREENPGKRPFLRFPVQPSDTQ